MNAFMHARHSTASTHLLPDNRSLASAVQTPPSASTTLPDTAAP
ncbi:hypothetical protein PF003_g35636 [Phytophthora fragariae]|nr:hypothetical protein PF003_g35636 [Phytophthora fragariae]